MSFKNIFKLENKETYFIKVLDHKMKQKPFIYSNQ